MSKQSRRTFMKNVTKAGAAAGVFAIGSGARKILGANEQVNVAVVGLHGRGGSHIGAYRGMEGVRVAALCDVDYRVLEGRAEKIEGVKKYQDVRELLEDKDIDAVSIATCNHWHSLITIWACQAGKDVYVEKPCSHNVFEGRKCVEAARKYNRMVQHGTQSRASNGWAKFAAIAQSGKYGKLLISKGYCCKPRWSIGFKRFEMPPNYVDFNLWLGPAPLQPYHANLVHYNWHWFWDFGNGDVGNQGVHQMDIARWATGKTLPNAVISLGGRYVNEPGFKDQGVTPNQIVSVLDYGDMLLLFETRGLVGKNGFDRVVDNELYFEEGVVKNGKFYPGGKGDGEALVDVEYKKRSEGNFENFISCVRSRNREDLDADILEGHYSAACCHLGNIAYRMGEQKKFEMPENFDYTENEVVDDSIMTMLENTKAIGVNVDNAMMRVGSKLKFDPAAERFVDNGAADWFLSRPYREPFVVPENV